MGNSLTWLGDPRDLLDMSDRRLRQISVLKVPFTVAYLSSLLEQLGLFDKYAAARLLGVRSRAIEIFLRRHLVAGGRFKHRYSRGEATTPYFNLRPFFPLLDRKSRGNTTAWENRSAPVLLDLMRMMAPKQHNPVDYRRVWNAICKESSNRGKYRAVGVHSKKDNRTISPDELQERITAASKRFRNRVMFVYECVSLRMHWFLPCRTAIDVADEFERIHRLGGAGVSFFTAKMK